MHKSMSLAAAMCGLFIAGCGPEVDSVEETPVPEDAVETVMVDGIEVRMDGLSASEASYKVDVMTLELAPAEGKEYKYRLEEGQTMVYSWESTGPVRVEMHAQTDDQVPGTAEFFEVLLSATEGHGAYTAPFPGIHGWWWNNLSEDEAVTVTVRSSGFYSYAIEFPSQEEFELDDVTSIEGN